MRSLLSLLLLSLAIVFAAEEAAPGGRRILAVLDDLGLKSSHSSFFRGLEERYTIDYVAASSTSGKLRKYGEWQYDHLILFAPSVKDPAGLTARTILDFIDDGHNVIIGADSSVSATTRDVASECGVEFDEEGTFVIDHFNYDASDASGDHTLIVADNVVSDAPVVVGKVDAPVLFRGVGQDIEEDSPLLFSLLTASSTAFSFFPAQPVTDEPHVVGRKTSLVTALQARNNARVIISGSLDLFSDRFFASGAQKAGAKSGSEKSGNEQFVRSFTQWALQERGVLRSSNVRHHLVGEKEAPAVYTIKEEVEYSVTLEQWDGKKWAPYLANDVQLEFSMLDPYVRTTLKHDSNGVYSSRFKLPDVYGVFTFRVDYVRKGYSFINEVVRSPVRPFRHNQYERFIDSAYPYYVSALSMLGGLFIFSAVFLYTREK
jgi:oligosaccharyltransferase complex subunit beta